MDFKNNDDLFGARNENSVLFSLEDLNSMDNDASSGADAGFGSSGDASGLINLDVLSQMGAASNSGMGGDYSYGDPSTGLGDDSILMGSMVFNDVMSKEKKKTIMGIVIGIIAIIAVACALIFFFVGKADEEAQDAKTAMQQQREIAANAESEVERAQLEKDMLEKKLKKLEEEAMAKAERAAELEKQLQNLNDAEMVAQVNADSKKSGSSSTKKADSGDSAKPAAAASTGGGSKPDPQKIKAALVDVSKKAKKCGKNGNLVVQMNINSSGSAKAVKGVSGSFKGTATEKCITTVVEKHQFPTFSGSAIPVKYNFKL